MPCPRCNSHNLWDDIMWWGCDDCGWMTSGEVHNRYHPKDKFNEKDKDIWEKWCREAAANAGITVEELKAKLDAGDGYLDIRATVTLQGIKND